MSNIEKAQQALDSFQEEPVFERTPIEDSHLRRLRVLHQVEDLVWDRVAEGHLTAVEAEEAIDDCRDWAYGTYEPSVDGRDIL